MTDSDIIKSFELCNDATCDGCQYVPMRDKYICIETLHMDIASMLKRQQAEIEQLKAEKAEFETEVEKQYEQARADILGNVADGGASCHRCIAEHKKNAVKDFAERLKAKAYKSCEWWPILHAVDAKDIDELVAEMESENGRD